MLGREQDALSPRAVDRDHGSTFSALELSPAQLGLVYLALVGEGGNAYNLSWAGRAVGQLDVVALAAAFKELGFVHEQLGRRIGLVGGQFMSYSASTELLASHFVRHGLSAEQRDADAQQMADADAAGGFELIGGALCRLTTVTYAPDDHLILLTVHHIVADGWSLEVIYRDLSEIYARIQSVGLKHYDPFSGTPGFSRYLKSLEAVSPTRRSLDLDAWNAELAGASFEIKLLEADHFSGRMSDAASARESLKLSRRGSDGVQTLVATTYSTPFMVTLAIFARALGLASARDDLVIGSPFGARPSAEFDKVVGMFVNTLPLRIRPCMSSSLKSTLTSTREATMFALEHQEVTLQEIVSSLNGSRDPRNDTFFSAAFTFVPWGTYVETLRFPNVEVTRVMPDGQAPKFPVLFTVTEQRDSTLVLTVEYALELVGPRVAKALLSSFVSIAELAHELPSESSLT